MVGLGTLQSPLPDSELVLRMIRELKETYHLLAQEQASLRDNHYSNFVHALGKEIQLLSRVEAEVQTKIVRATQRLRNAEQTLQNYHGQIKKSGHPQAHMHLATINQILSKMKTLKTAAKSDRERSIRRSNMARDLV